MLVISYPKNNLLGGFGDRIIGLISIRLISKLLNKDFYIEWNKEDIKSYIDYSKYDFNLIKDKSDDKKILNMIGRSKRRKARNYLNIKKPFPNKITKICLNYELAQFFYKNKSFSDKGDYKKDIINAYEELWTEILIPTELLKNKINSIIKDTKKIVGIQIRCGDLGMITNKGEKESYNNHYPETIKNIKKYLENIKDHIEIEDYNVFITSDSNDAVNKAKEVWEEDKILYNYDLIQHIDRKAVNNDISKVFVDSYILSQKSDILYISEYSNFGRIAVLSCGHELIYNLKCEKLKKINMVSKRIKLFS